jgi:hypothetical protein
MKELVIKLKMDRSQAAQAADEQVKDHRKIADSADSAARQTRKANTAAYSEQQVQARATAQIVAKANADRVKAAVDAAVGEQKAHKATSVSILDMYATANLAEKGFQGLLKVANGIRDAFKEADQYSRGLRGGFTQERESLAELAAIQGKAPDNAFVAANAAYNTRAGFKPAEGIAFRSEYANSGAQYAGKNISQAEYEQFELQAGQLAVARGMNPKESGDFAGKVLGLKDFTKFGDQASEQALATQNSALEVLKRGSGDNAVLIAQFNKVASSMLSEDQYRGVESDPDKLAAMISVAAEKSPTDAAETVKGALRAVRAFGDPNARPMLDAAGVTPTTSPIDAFRSIGKVAEAEARAKGMKVSDVLASYFHNNLEAEGLGVMINKGLSGGIFDDRAALVAGAVPGMPSISGPGPALATIAQYQGTERGQLRVAEAATKETELGLGGQNSRLQGLEEQAKRNLLARGETGTTGAEIADFFMSATSFGQLDPKQGRLRGEMSTILANRANAAGLAAYTDPTRIGNGFSTEAVNQEYNKALTAVEKAERDKAVAAMQANTKAIEDQNRMMQKQTPAIPAPLAAPRPVPTR